MAIFGLWESDRLVDPFLCFHLLEDCLGFKLFSWRLSTAGVFNPFTPSMWHFRDEGILFDLVPFLGFFLSKDFKSPLFPLEGFFLFLLRTSRTSACPLGGCFLSRVLGLFFSLFPWPIWILFYFWLRSPFPSRMCPS